MRIYDPRVGRFLSVDPITRQYPQLTPYQYASNTPIQAIDLDGLEAWVVKNTWNEDYIKLFRNQLNSNLEYAKTCGKKYTCDDLGLESVISFAKANNLPFKWTTESGEFDAESPTYKDYDAFLLAVKQRSGAPDFANKNNSRQINFESLQGGDLAVMTSAGGKRPNHVQMVTGIWRNEEGSVAGYNAKQGNFRQGFLAGRLFGSDDPESFRYLGVEVQQGAYFKSNDTWYNATLKSVTPEFSTKEYSIDFRTFNFEEWNKKYEYYQVEKDSYSTSPTTGAPVRSTFKIWERRLSQRTTPSNNSNSENGNNH